jgi:putative ubiquitin-RnfH superfamily antitoxin RatB of RatAB toxin-antitoxin module
MGLIKVEVAFAMPDRQCVVALQLPQGSTTREAIETSGILARFPGIDLARDAVGIFGRRVSLAQQLKAGDRVEIYRTLTADPKLARRQRAEQARGKPRGQAS